MAQEQIENVESIFAFNKLPKSKEDKHIVSHGYEAYFNPQLPDFVCFKNLHAPNNDSKQSKGHKFHLSIDDPQNDKTNNFEKAWPILLKNLTDAQVTDFKIVHGNARYQNQMQGKQVTIYAFKELDRKAVPNNDAELLSWQEIFQKLTDDLAKAGIRPGVLAATGNEEADDDEILYDKEVNGSNYISYRDDSLNQSMKDPFESIKVNCKKQIDRAYPVENIMKQIDNEIGQGRYLDAYNGSQKYINLYRDCLRNDRSDDATLIRNKIDRFRQYLGNDFNNKHGGKLDKKEADESIKLIDKSLKELDKVYKEEDKKLFNISFGFGSNK